MGPLVAAAGGKALTTFGRRVMQHLPRGYGASGPGEWQASPEALSSACAPCRRHEAVTVISARLDLFQPLRAAKDR